MTGDMSLQDGQKREYDSHVMSRNVFDISVCFEIIFVLRITFFIRIVTSSSSA